MSQVATLNKATAYIFTDMQTAERHQHALDCYSTTSKRCGALLQWINMVRTSESCLGQLGHLLHSQVVHSTIKTDLEDINAKVHQAATDLRKERIRLIKVSVGVLYYKNEKLFSE